MYIDTSALLKLAHAEAESMPLRTWLARHPDDLLSLALTRAEARRALLRNDPTALPQLARVLAFVAQIPITEASWIEPRRCQILGFARSMRFTLRAPS
jgi:uncharacterized protein